MRAHALKAWNHERLMLGLGLLLCLLIVLAHAWVSEDAYLTFRVVDNALQGYGLRWNIHERVQVYTHPLWMLLHLPFYALYHNIFIVTIALGITCSMLALIVLIRTVSASWMASLLLWLLPLAAARTFTEYATSGLESSLSFLLFALFLFNLLRLEKHPAQLFYCTLIAAFALVNRLDALWLYAPCMAHILLQRWSKASIKQALLGLTPLLLWLGFSFFYYGFLLPNTAYAKLGSGLPLEMQLSQGEEYFHLYPLYDLPSSLWLFIALPLLTTWLIRTRHCAQHAALALLGIGALLMLVYVFYVGGDYMQGRFFAVPLFVTHALCFVVIAPRLRGSNLRAATCLLASAYGWYAYDYYSCPGCYSPDTVGTIIDARATFSDNNLVASFLPLKLRGEGQHGFGEEGRELHDMGEPKIKVQSHAGMAGFYAGPEVTLIDLHGLSDPLIARLPSTDTRRFYAGHFPRMMPRGYLIAVHTGDTSEMNPALAAYYAPIREIIQDDLFSWHRLKTVIAFQLGFYDDRRDAYLQHN